VSQGNCTYRRKFSNVDDNFLLLAATEIWTRKDLDVVCQKWLPNKTSNEIKHRFKNLTCRRAATNELRKWKAKHNMPLRQGWMTKEGVNTSSNQDPVDDAEAKLGSNPKG
jgi:hypothetical protein